MPDRSLFPSSTSSPERGSAEVESGERPDGPRRSERLARVAVFAFIALLGFVAVALAVGSFASYPSVKARLDSFASDGDADVTRGDFDAIVVRLRLAAAAAALAAVAAHAGRRRLRRLVAELASSAMSAISSLHRGLGATVARESRLHLATLGLVTSAALVVRLEFLFQPMRYDESVTFVHYASRPWYIAITNYTAPNNHVLNSILVHISTLVFGGEPWAIRLPALIAGVLLVPASYVTARALYGRHAALVAASLVASSSVLVEYSTNARGYTLLALIFVLLLALATHLATSSNPAEWLAFAVLGAIGFYTVPVMLYGFGGVVVWLGLSLVAAGRRSLLMRRLLPAVLFAGALSALLYAPIIAASGLHSLVANEFVGARSWSTFTSTLPHSLVSAVRGWHRDIPLPLAAVLGVGFFAALVFHRQLSRFRPPALAVLVWIAPVVVAQRVVPFERVWLFLLPLYLMTAAAGIVLLLRPLMARVGREEAVAAVVAVVLVGSLAGNAVATQAVYHSEDTSTFRDGEQVAGLLARRLRPGDKVLVAPPADAILEYQLNRRGLDPAALLYWAAPGDTSRFLAVLKDAPGNYTLEHLVTDPRLEGVRLGEPRLLRRYKAASVYEIRRAGSSERPIPAAGS